MRVLWVCNIIPAVLAGEMGMEAGSKEGWLSGLLARVLDDEKSEIELGVAFPVARKDTNFTRKIPVKSGKKLACYGFYEDLSHPEIYGADALENSLGKIIRDFGPDLVHCFGTEYGHTLAAVRAYSRPQRTLIGIQGLCSVYAQAYLASLPDDVTDSVTFRDRIRHDSIRQQQRKFELRGEFERQAIESVGNVSGRTKWDAAFANEWNPEVSYYEMNETLRPDFYTGSWKREDSDPYRIFLSQGDYPVKGLHYMLLALPEILEDFPETKVCIAGNCLIRKKSPMGRMKICAYGKYLEELIRSFHLENVVEFAGMLDAGGMKARYLESGLFVCPSSMENSPNSLGEAMLLGMPCVSADVGGIPSLFRDGVDGLLYSGYEIGEGRSLEEIAGNLALTVKKMFADPDRADRYGENAAEHAGKTHDRDENYRRLLEIYEEIAGKD